jgi:hypothetical protein
MEEIGKLVFLRGGTSGTVFSDKMRNGNKSANFFFGVRKVAGVCFVSLTVRVDSASGYVSPILLKYEMEEIGKFLF